MSDAKEIVNRLKQAIDYTLNEHLCDMKPGWDDSIEGFNQAREIVLKVLNEALKKEK